ncbi:hypothetical protein Stsp02_54840 [Streptomyces sp. NBRC 14336]|uniref:WXG100 family type VII secretion target n=1 Tax=Streptomyces fuscus TaxID=3048495 RepID=A0ABT7J212_9ACTN|nr:MULTISPECIES: hypothetical protein [Streptomyces]WBO78859.1 hypothetical protein SBE_002497 [Streptomyces sp. SBE_14.2]MCM1968751.1 hypothetical protein [Streptomyces sp. G1]MDL2078904.1 hypothetical protein [Streptomyces fuscus]SBT95957.1 hypothetical protein GA0115233_11984 [Streptomyces sp. DI166]GLW49823.1 hypothetical protein Stsp02_54840 [Streptomyces sp. NBRC 14336]
MKFDMGSTTLAELGKSTGGSVQDLGTLISWLVQAAEPLEGKFNGAGKAAFDRFKLNADEITNALNSSLDAILGGQVGMDTAFSTGDTELEDNANRNIGVANFDAARFGAR